MAANIADTLVGADYAQNDQHNVHLNRSTIESQQQREIKLIFGVLKENPLAATEVLRHLGRLGYYKPGGTLCRMYQAKAHRSNTSVAPYPLKSPGI